MKLIHWIVLICILGSSVLAQVEILDLDGQLNIFNTINSTEESVIGFTDSDITAMLNDMKSVFTNHNFSLLYNDLKKRKQPVSPELINIIAKSTIFPVMPNTDTYDHVRTLNSEIRDRIDFILDLKKRIQDSLWASEKLDYLAEFSEEIDFSLLDIAYSHFELNEYNKSELILGSFERQLWLKTYQNVEVKKDSLKVIQDCEHIAISIKDEGFIDRYTKDKLGQAQEFFSSRNYYMLITRIDDINLPSMRTTKLILTRSNSSTQKPVNKDYETLLEYKFALTNRKLELNYIKNFIQNLGLFLETESIFVLTDKNYSKDFANVRDNFSNNEYDLAYSSALSLELEIEDKTVELLMSARQTLTNLSDNNQSISYLLDLIGLAYEKFAPFKKQELLALYEQTNQDDKITFIKTELGPARLRMKIEEHNDALVDLDSVISIVSELKYRDGQIWRISESIDELSKSLDGYSSMGVDTNVSEKKFYQALEDFQNENYDDAESKLIETSTKLTAAKARLTVLNVLSIEGLTFLQRNKFQIIIVILLIIIFGFIGWSKIRYAVINKQLYNLTEEKKILIGLVKKIQIEHFMKGATSRAIYEIKYDNYNARLNSVRAEIPIKESILKKQAKFNKKIRGIFLKFVPFVKTKSRKINKIKKQNGKKSRK